MYDMQVTKKGYTGCGAKKSPDLHIVCDLMPDHVSDELVDQDNCNVLAVGVLLEGILYPLHRSFCNIIFFLYQKPRLRGQFRLKKPKQPKSATC